MSLYGLKAGRTIFRAETKAASVGYGAVKLQTRSLVVPSGLRLDNGSRGVPRHVTGPKHDGFASAVVPSSRRSLTTLGDSRKDAIREASTNASPHPRYEAVVVGAGAAGIAAVGNLLEQKVGPILWVDPVFEAGRVNRCYREVPSNTKVRLFIDFATATAPFRGIVSGKGSKHGDEVAKEALGKGDQLSFLRSLEQEKGCELGKGADMLLLLSKGLRRDPSVNAQSGRVTEATFNDTTSQPSWTVRLDKDEHAGTQPTISHAETSRLLLCTGSSPNNSPLPIPFKGVQDLDLDAALSPTILSTTFASHNEPITVAVIGASHSAILVLRNFYNLAKTQCPNLRVKWFTRHPLRYAEPQPDGWVLRENTGLKSEAAQWARESLEPETMPTSEVGKYITKIGYNAGEEQEIYAKHMPGCDWYVQAIGYDRDPLPTLRMGSSGKEVRPVFDHDQGYFKYEDGQARLPGLFGAGIAFPERVTDPHGNVEMNVGFWKFMKAAKKWVEVWK